MNFLTMNYIFHAKLPQEIAILRLNGTDGCTAKNLCFYLAVKVNDLCIC